MRKHRRYAEQGLLKEYGFVPDYRQIQILEAHDEGNDCQYVRFSVGGHEYSYDGITMEKRS